VNPHSKILQREPRRAFGQHVVTVRQSCPAGGWDMERLRRGKGRTLTITWQAVLSFFNRYLKGNQI